MTMEAAVAFPLERTAEDIESIPRFLGIFSSPPSPTPQGSLPGVISADTTSLSEIFIRKRRGRPSSGRSHGQQNCLGLAEGGIVGEVVGLFAG
jgi:hypothetical protein